MAMKLIDDFLKKVLAIYKTGVATEHSYRSAIEALFSGLNPDISALNEPKRVACGAPDFIVQRGQLVIGHIEAKDIGVGLRQMKEANKNQQERYRQALPNLIYTNCLDWDFYRNGDLVASVTIATQLEQAIQPRPENYATLLHLLQEFSAQHPQTITKPDVLAKMMAGKAVLIKDVLHRALLISLGQQRQDANVDFADTEADQGGGLVGQYQAFKEQLIHDISLEDFADIYAETMAYGMFAARLHDESLETFSRQEALTLLPKSNPFLRGLFAFIAGNDLDERLVWIVDDLAMVFQAANVAKIMEGFGKLTGQNDPFLHFYETFLAAYNPAKRKARGVWYTPEPVVNFIVRAVDEVLQHEFGLPDGLADTSKMSIDWDTGQKDKKGKPVVTKKEVHRVQILDPATGTGTFLAEVIKQIAPKIKGIAPAMWSSYIEKDLIPRLHGFELLMASYAMCHMKLDMILTELGYKPTRTPPRLSVYLTNSLEEGEKANCTLPFAQWLSNEAKQANTIKRDMPIMCVLGNPPYLGEGGKSEGWLGDLMEDYKKEPGGKEKLKERNPKWLNDLYVKFIRMSSHLIEKNGEGVLGFITNHGYLDNPTFRGMRWHLLHTFDKIWVLDLHGNSKKKEVTPEGSPDKNVFDIQQGVAIIIAAKKQGTKKGLATVMHGDLWGERAKKYAALEESTLASSSFVPLDYVAPDYRFVKRSFADIAAYQAGFSVSEFLPINSVGIVTARDSLTIDIEKNTVWARVQNFVKMSPEQARQEYELGKDVRDWQVQWAQDDVLKNLSEQNLASIAYRPFDVRSTFYTGNSRGFMCYPRKEVMQHMFQKNIGFAFTRTIEGKRDFADVLVFDKPITHHSLSIKEVNILCPLYLYPDGDTLLDQEERRVNFDLGLYQKLQKLAEDAEHGLPDEVQVFDYIYGVLHCPSYRTRYAEFLKIDFPRIPWPRSAEEFWYLSQQGTALRKLHLMDKTSIGRTPYPFCGERPSDKEANRVEKLSYQDGKIWINSEQYFDNAPESAWTFYIGGYQPAQKWLKDRKDRTLNFADVQHYQRILKILAETHRIMEAMNIHY